MLSQIRGVFEAHVEGLFTNRDLISQWDDREPRTLCVDEVEPSAVCWDQGNHFPLSLVHKQNWGSRLTENKTNAALFENKFTQEKKKKKKHTWKKTFQLKKKKGQRSKTRSWLNWHLYLYLFLWLHGKKDYMNMDLLPEGGTVAFDRCKKQINYGICRTEEPSISLQNCQGSVCRRSEILKIEVKDVNAFFFFLQEKSEGEEYQ